MNRIFVFILISFFFFNCGDEKNLTEPVYPAMTIFAELKNYQDYNSDDIFSNGQINVIYYPPVTKTEYLIDGLIVFEDDYSGMVGRAWYYDENPESPWYDENEYHWVTNKDYEIEINAQFEKQYMAKSTCQVPGNFTINESLLPESIDTSDTFELNWSNCDNETNFRLYFLIWDNEYEIIIDSTIIIEPDVNSFTFTNDLINYTNANGLYIRLEAINGPHVGPGSSGNIEGDGYGYYFGSFAPETIFIEYSTNLNRKSNDQIKDIQHLINEYAIESFKRILGF